MSNRDALRKLSKKFPPPKEVRSIMDALRTESDDLAAAIVAASILESALEKFLIAAMREKSPRILGQLFENRGPLSDFNGKILIAVAFGVLTPGMGEHFQSIRHIRNAFAHARIPITFETREVAKEIDGWSMLRAMQGVDADMRKEGKYPEGAIPFSEIPRKAAFLLIISILLIILDDMYERQGHGNLYEGWKEPASQ